MTTHRVQRVAERIRQELGPIFLHELNDPRMKMVSVVRVDLAPDMRSAKVYFSVLGSEADVRTAQRTLDHAKGRIQSLVGNRLATKHTPKLTFKADDSIKKSVDISKLIDEALNE